MQRADLNWFMRSALCDLLDIDVPIVLAPFGPWEQVELVHEIVPARELVARLVADAHTALDRAGLVVDRLHPTDQAAPR
jgi:hypothetical protein